MTDQRMLAVIMEDVKKIILLLGEHGEQIKQNKEDIEPIEGLVAWKNKWAGALIALSGVATVVSLVVGLKVFFL